MFVIGITPRVDAGFCPSETVPAGAVHAKMTASPNGEDRSADLQKIQKALELKMVRERLEKLGFTQQEIQTRLNQVDNQQLHQLALKIDELRTGGDGTGFVIGILIIAILVVILLQLTGHKVIISQR